MRKLLIGALTGTVMLLIAAVAYAATVQEYDQKYSTKKPKTSAGTTFTTKSIDEENTANNKQPAPVRQLDIKFPAGTKIDQKAKPFCKNFNESEEKPCPDNTLIGKGNAEAIVPLEGFQTVLLDVFAYNRKGGLYVYAVPTSPPGQAPVLLRPTFKGLTLSTNIPPQCIASAPDASGNCPNGEAILSKFFLKTKAFKKGKRIFIRTPKTCPKSKKWVFTAKFQYGHGEPNATRKSDSPCKK